MTLARLQAEITSAEFEFWVGLAMVRGEECPNCGHEAKDMMDYQWLPAKCPICDYRYGRPVHKSMAMRLVGG